MVKESIGKLHWQKSGLRGEAGGRLSEDVTIILVKDDPRWAKFLLGAV